MSMADWLRSELTRKMASLPDDRARHKHLVLCKSAWRLKQAQFLEFGTQPFNEPHPLYGDMNARDFKHLLSEIELWKTLVRQELV